MADGFRLIGRERSIELAPLGGFASLTRRDRDPRNGEGAPEAPLRRSFVESSNYGAQTLFSTLLTEMVPPGPCFQAYQLPFCEMMQ